MSRKLRCGVIGCGVIAPVHVASYKRDPNVEVAWACDLVEAKATQLADRSGIERVTTDYREVLADPTVDCISVCTDHASHAPITADALDAGKDVLCEKALAAAPEGLDRMFAAHGRNPERIFAGVFQHRFDYLNRVMKRFLDEGTFGRLLTACVHMRCLRTPEYYLGDRWRGTWAEEGGAVLINQTIHFLDSMLWLMGGAVSVCGAYTNLTHGDVIETEDTVAASLRFASGALGTLEATSSSHLGWEPTIEIHGTTGSVELRGTEVIKAQFVDSGAAERLRTELDRAKEETGDRLGKSYYGSSHPLQIADFLDAVRRRRQPFVPAWSARHTVEVVFGIYASHRTGKWVDVKPPKEASPDLDAQAGAAERSA